MDEAERIALIKQRRQQLDARRKKGGKAPVDYHPSQAAPLRLLAIARMLPRGFSFEELAIAAWEFEPERWGMKGFEAEYPDTNRVGVVFFGRFGLRRRGLVELVGMRTYCVARTANEVEVARAEK